MSRSLALLVIFAATALCAPARAVPVSRTAELLAIVEAEHDPVAALRREIAATRDPARALELQRRIEALKRGTVLGVLRAQRAHALRDGRSETVARLDRAIEATLASFRTRSHGSAPAQSPPR